MAEVNQGGGGGGRGKKGGGKVRAKKQSTKVDMTPMVDLAFLLLTFFILTSTFNKPKTMEVTMPDKVKDETEQTKINENDILNIVLGDKDKIYYWTGLTPPAEVTNYSKDGIRKLLLDRNRENPKLMVLIKPQDESRYNNMVDILDEMEITATKRYAIVDFTPDDKAIISGNLEDVTTETQTK
ncbi:ExbD/TolR family protein [Chryseosolibacter indicus]|uniref:Biopolymer transporter ExbD n=1 Tax=Chryseosolibacter indicus TaxID=2782351 RepID=A0ABS5VW41_9BACT|nr:biopolymer transporter ExbD [Chryseosolibacter indicus]MBT1704944.1 biopolymer transporter ExbD [Chryseosolibacter indicus]